MTRILLVEDDSAIRDMLLEFLADEGYDVHTAGNGRDGVDLAHAIAPDLIVMDLMLPVLTGAEAIRRLRADPMVHAIPIIAISAGAYPRTHGIDLPADGIIAKPFDLDTLLAAIRAQLRAHEV